MSHEQAKKQLEAGALMTFPVQCAHCGQTYDLGAVEVIGRYTDCSVWKAPCCGTTVDDRGDTGWKTRKDYYRLSGAVSADVFGAAVSS